MLCKFSFDAPYIRHIRSVLAESRTHFFVPYKSSQLFNFFGCKRIETVDVFSGYFFINHLAPHLKGRFFLVA